jgi:hypothetical protein
MSLQNPMRALRLPMFLLAAAACWADTDKIVTSEGQVSGIFKSANSHAVIIEVATGEEITLPWSTIQQITFAHPTLVEGPGFGNGKGLLLEKGATITVAERKITLPLGPPDDVPKPLSKIQSMMPLPDAPVASNSAGSGCTSGSTRKGPTWTGSATPKYTLTEGTQSVQTVGGSLMFRRAQNTSCTSWQHQATNLILDATNTLTEQVGTPSIRSHEYDGQFLHQVYLASNVYLEGIASGFHNSSFDLYLEQSYGGGIGGKYSKGMVSLDLSADALFVTEHFTTVKSVSFAAARLTEEFTAELVKKNVKKPIPVVFAESISYLPAFNQPNAWQIRGAVQLFVPITKKLSFVPSFFEDYMENVPNGRKNYSTTSVGLNFSLGQN